MFGLLPVITTGYALCPTIAYAQLEPGDRGIPPVETTENLLVTGIRVDVSASSGENARLIGWRLAERKAWQLLWDKRNDFDRDDNLKDPTTPFSDKKLDSIVSSVVVEKEEIGPNRYIATLGVEFDRARGGSLLGLRKNYRHSPPMLLVPLTWTAGAPVSFEWRNAWQKAWAEFKTSHSHIAYVRPTGDNLDPVLLNATQLGSQNQIQWQNILEQYGASGLLTPEIRIHYSWPGGPVSVSFLAKYGIDQKILGHFTLKAASIDNLPVLLKQGVEHIDAIYMMALFGGNLGNDRTFIAIEAPASEVATFTQRSVPAPAYPRDENMALKNNNSGGLSSPEKRKEAPLAPTP
ncbi:hypothetical protein [Zymomonas mobilis]|uniref:hypothetical protein n=1 Tax=Zymomonas mobilis TaxID=542 RepID=UPI0021AB12D4|nr:hypothetical protein [Zymomonas mobilis]